MHDRVRQDAGQGLTLTRKEEGGQREETKCPKMEVAGETRQWDKRKEQTKQNRKERETGGERRKERRTNKTNVQREGGTWSQYIPGPLCLESTRTIGPVVA
ncbi:uncharacterized protein SPSK_00947 [Sporothrix schenckii 1099-18]|uniref:Uncharacterized protein n=1 Tax=Sporothrix schenckii 1099-18 TaxID=1397361 RepID=A0A0F2LWE4_SPOSC|nr:uncharacterized protein SPSK_00947 [Sporothrix schenckii 1099-18]KJR81792.1 hypothetical protein SPSK_00947 [Sporothrix schenckii 1099-18]